MPGRSPTDEDRGKAQHNRRGENSSSEEGTMVDEAPTARSESHNHLEPFPNYQTHNNKDGNHLTLETGSITRGISNESFKSPSQNREQANRLDDDLKMLQIERQVSQANAPSTGDQQSTRSGKRNKARREEMVDDFDAATNPLHEKAAIYKIPEHPASNFAKAMKRVHESSFLIRYFTYITPIVLIILIPLLIGALLPGAKGPHGANVGGVELLWFCVWLEIVWLTLWAGRILAKMLPHPVGLIATLFTNSNKKWRDMAKQLELPATLFFWWLGIEISFLPTMKNHQVPPHGKDAQPWMVTTNKIWVAILVAAGCNFIEKIIIQLIAMSFHMRTYADRIEINKFQIQGLTKLYTFSKIKIAMEDSDFEAPSGEPGSGTRTPGQYLDMAAKNTKEAFNKFGDVAGKIAGDFTGKKVQDSAHPHQVVINLLASTGGSQVLARRLYRTFAREETETVHQEDLNEAFESKDEADAAFSMFDKDLNGDISMEELEAVCVEIGRERKSITASLKDLDSVTRSLDAVLMFVVLIIFIIVLVSLIATSASGVLTSLGSLVLGLSWLFSTTAQEFLQSIVFVFVKHPFDVGDRVTIYGNTGVEMKGDDYFVKEISLLYTEFKKMEGHIVQAPNSYLNTLFILNQRRSGGLAEAYPVIFKYGTTLEQIEGLRNKLLEFVRAEKREFQNNILTELREITEAHSISLNIVYFFKSNWQNEALRLQRRNKFVCALMISMQELGIEGPYMRFPGQRESFPVYMQHMPYNTENHGYGGNPDNPFGRPKEDTFVPEETQSPAMGPRASMDRGAPSVEQSRSTRRRGESIAQMGKRYDFSLGMGSLASGDLMGDVYEQREKPRLPINVQSPSPGPRNSGSRHRDRSTSIRKLHSTSRSQTMPAHESDIPRTSLHRNRFFGRRSHEGDKMETGMAGIPERESYIEPPNVTGRMDPRSGTISPAAMETLTTSIQPGPSATAKSDSHDFEIERL